MKRALIAVALIVLAGCDAVKLYTNLPKDENVLFWTQDQRDTAFRQMEKLAPTNAIDYVITQSSGALKLDGGGSIQTALPRQIAYSGYITPSPALPDALLSQIKAMGQPAADGRIRIDWKARW